MKKRVKLIFIIIISLIIDTLLIYLLDTNLVIDSIVYKSFDSETKIITVEVNKNKGFLFKSKFNCVAYGSEMSIHSSGKNNKCTLNLPTDENYRIHLDNGISRSESKSVLDYIHNQLSFKFTEDKIILPVEDTYQIKYQDDFIVPVEVFYTFNITDSEIISVQDGIITGLKPGKATIIEPNSGEKMVVEVTDLLVKAEIPKTRKPVVPCNKITEEGNDKLDEYLEYYVNKAGYQTRAGVVAAGRFLTLQFKYRVPYFYENGRVNETGVNYADGEGRYYKKGLYVDSSRYKDIKYKFNGPASWGCPLRNWDNNEAYGFVAGNKMPNGLDCSGFVSWALYNGGFDPGDVGAGDTPGKYQLTKTGKFTKITSGMIKNNEIKTGDLFNYQGHIALIIGQDENYYYVAESLPHLRGVVPTKYLKTKVVYTFPNVVFMDEYYKNDGNLTDYWE